MNVATRRGTTLVVHDLGGDGPDLLIAHATGFCGRAYEPVARNLTGRHHVWAVDFPGHGDSPAPPDDDFEWTGFVTDLAEVVEAIDCDELHAFGHSMGGAVVLQAEADRPGTFKTVFAYEPIVAPPGTSFAENPLAEAARRRREVFGSREAALWRYASRPPLDELAAGSLAAYVIHGFEALPDGTVRLKCRAENEARTFEASGSITTATVAGASVPVTVAWGARRPEMPAALAPALVSALPNARGEVFDHLGHFGPFQDPAGVAARVIALSEAPSVGDRA